MHRLEQLSAIGMPPQLIIMENNKDGSNELQSLESLDARGMCKLYGLRWPGGPMKNPNTKATGGHAGVDKEYELCEYVRATAGFHETEALILHVYARFKPIWTFEFRQKGETLIEAAGRQGQLEYLRRMKRNGLTPTDADMSRAMLRSFLASLGSKIRNLPFKVTDVEEIEPAPMDDAEATAALATFLAEQKYPSKYKGRRS